jgi:hypothetical protein
MTFEENEADREPPQLGGFVVFELLCIFVAQKTFEAGLRSWTP